MPAAWQLPPGVTPALWDYLHDPALASAYDAGLADTPLLQLDEAFFREHCPRPARCIDLGCGTGRLALALAAAGYPVTAVDLAAPMLQRAGAKADRAGLMIDRVQANLVELECLADGAFAYAACLFSTLGMIDGAEARRRFIGHVYRLLRPGGVFVLHAHNLWFHLRTRGGRRLLYRQLWRRWRHGQPLGDCTMPPHQGLGSLTIHLFTRRELYALLTDAGFQIRETRPVSINGAMAAPWWLGGLRGYGFLVAAVR